MHTTTQRWCLWAGPAFILLFLAGFLVTGWLPPPAPGQAAPDVARMYAEDNHRIRAGLYLLTASAPLIMPWVVAISMQLRRADEPNTAMVWLQLAMGFVNVFLFLFPPLVWQVAAFRPDLRPAADVQLMHDLGWLPFVGAPVAAAVQNTAIAVCVLQDPGPVPVLPRWVGYFNLWCALLYLPGSLVVFFHTGPFAWSGVFTFWLGLVAFAVWFAVMLVVLRRALDRWGSPAAAARTRVGQPA